MTPFNFGKVIQAGFLLAVVLLCGCGGGESAKEQTSTIGFSNGASVSLIPEGSGKYVVKGDKLDNVGGIIITVRYDAANSFSPLVTKGDFVSGAMFAANSSSPGVIKMAVVKGTGMSGTGDIANIAFASSFGTPGTVLDTVEMVDTNSTQLH